jgi:hypothetical protein
VLATVVLPADDVEACGVGEEVETVASTATIPILITGTLFISKRVI